MRRARPIPRATRALVAGLLLLAPAPPDAAPAAGRSPEALAIDGARSEVRFHLKAPGHGVEGRSGALEGAVVLGERGLSDARSGRARLPVDSLHAGNPLIDRNMRRALGAAEHPEIRFEARRFARRGEGAGPRAPWRGVVEGELTVRGVTRTVAFDVEAVRQGEALGARGSAEFKLSDFGIDPPRFLGFLRVKDWVRVEFDVLAMPRAPEASGAAGAPIASTPEAP